MIMILAGCHASTSDKFSQNYQEHFFKANLEGFFLVTQGLTL